MPIIEGCDIIEALSNSTPMLLRGVDLQKGVAFGWDDIGGLAEVKTELKEVFEWPAMVSLFLSSFSYTCVKKTIIVRNPWFLFPVSRAF